MATPTGLTSSGITTTSATVSWTAVPGAVTYNLQWKPSSSSTWTTVSGITTTSSDLTGLTEVTTYQFQVQTVCSAGSSSYSIAASFATTSGSTGTGKRYYFSSTDGDDSRTSAQAQSSSTPWRTLSKLNSFFSSLQPGDNVYFKRGDTFYGSITASSSGISGSSIYFDAYGTGNKPIITGFTDVTSWSNIGSNLWMSSNSVSSLATLNMVAIGGSFASIGKWPTNGYNSLTQSGVGTSITHTSLTSNWNSGTVVIRKNHWIIDKSTITSQSGTTINFSNPTSYTASSGWGFFIQNHQSACDVQNEWWYDASSKKIGIYSSGTPSGIQVSTIDNLVSIGGNSFLNFNNISFQGSNSAAVTISSGNNIKFEGCGFLFQGINGFTVQSSAHHITLNNCTANYTNNDFVFGGGSTNWTFTNNVITNTAQVPGMGSSADGNYIALYNIGANSLIQYNEIRKTGYIGIDFRGAGISILNNLVDTFCNVKDDGGAIYTYTGSSPVVYSQRTVSNNIVLNGGGAGAGTTTTNSDAFGIYMDDLASNVTISGNTVANCGSSGIFLHAAHDISLTNNTLYNNVLTGGYGQILIKQESSGLIRNITLTGNVVVSKASTQLVAYYWSNVSDFNQWGTFDTNYYCRPVSETNTFSLIKSSGNQNTDLAGWQSVSTKETNSKKSPKTITNVNSLRFEYNATSSNQIIGLGAAYLDAKGISFPSSITLAPYTSTVLITASGGTTLAENTAEIVDENNLTEKPSLTIYPNPVRDNFVLQLNNSQTGKMNVQVVNQAGAIIRSYLFNKDQMVNQVTVPANDLPTGVYFVHVQIGTWSDKRKIVKL